MENNLLRLVLYSFPSLFQHFAVPYKTGARIGCQLEILRQLETVSRTSLLAQSAEHATRSIKDKLVEDFLAARLAGHDNFDIHGKDVDAVFGAGQRAKVASDAERVMRFRIHV